MNPKEIIEKLRLTFNELVNQTPVKMADVVLVDGTTIQVSDMIVGGMVTIQGQPAPMGEYETQDGQYLVVGDNGAIVEIQQDQAVQPVEPITAPTQMNKFEEFESATKQKFADYESKFASYEVKFSDYESRLNKATQVIDALLNVTKTLAETPTGVPDVKVAQFSNEEKKSKSYDILFS